MSALGRAGKQRASGDEKLPEKEEVASWLAATAAAGTSVVRESSLRSAIGTPRPSRAHVLLSPDRRKSGAHTDYLCFFYVYRTSSTYYTHWMLYRVLCGR